MQHCFAACRAVGCANDTLTSFSATPLGSSSQVVWSQLHCPCRAISSGLQHCTRVTPSSGAVMPQDAVLLRCGNLSPAAAVPGISHEATADFVTGSTPEASRSDNRVIDGFRFSELNTPATAVYYSLPRISSSYNGSEFTDGNTPGAYSNVFRRTTVQIEARSLKWTGSNMVQGFEMRLIRADAQVVDASELGVSPAECSGAWPLVDHSPSQFVSARSIGEESNSFQSVPASVGDYGTVLPPAVVVLGSSMGAGPGVWPGSWPVPRGIQQRVTYMMQLNVTTTNGWHLVNGSFITVVPYIPVRLQDALAMSGHSGLPPGVLTTL
jgi:hypothetical protein